MIKSWLIVGASAILVGGCTCARTVPLNAGNEAAGPTAKAGVKEEVKHGKDEGEKGMKVAKGEKKEKDDDDDDDDDD